MSSMVLSKLLALSTVISTLYPATLHDSKCEASYCEPTFNIEGPTPATFTAFLELQVRQY